MGPSPGVPQRYPLDERRSRAIRGAAGRARGGLRLQGVAEPAAWEQVLVSGLLAVTLLLALRAARVRPVLMRWAVAVAIAVVAISAAGAAVGHIDNATAEVPTCNW